MNIFVYSSLNKELRTRLIAEIGSKADIAFYVDNKAGGRDEFDKAEIVLGNPPVAWFESGNSSLRFWQLDSAGFNQYANVNIKAVVANMGDFFSIPCAETMMAGIIGFFRIIPELATLQREQKWLGARLREKMDVLSGKKVLILGAGGIAQATGAMLRGFNCPTLFTARQARGADIITFDTALERLTDIDVVINTLPGNADKLVSSGFFDRMKTGALYASVGRGNTTDEQALIDALTSGKLRGAVLDVTYTEPLPSDHILWTFPNVVLTQHTGGGQRNEDEGKVSLFMENLNLFLGGGTVHNRIDIRRGY